MKKKYLISILYSLLITIFLTLTGCSGLNNINTNISHQSFPIYKPSTIKDVITEEESNPKKSPYIFALNYMRYRIDFWMVSQKMSYSDLVKKVIDKNYLVSRLTLNDINQKVKFHTEYTLTQIKKKIRKNILQKSEILFINTYKNKTKSLLKKGFKIALGKIKIKSIKIIGINKVKLNLYSDSSSWVDVMKVNLNKYYIKALILNKNNIEIIPIIYISEGINFNSVKLNIPLGNNEFIDIIAISN